MPQRLIKLTISRPRVELLEIEKFKNLKVGNTLNGLLVNFRISRSLSSRMGGRELISQVRETKVSKLERIFVVSSNLEKFDALFSLGARIRASASVIIYVAWD